MSLFLLFQFSPPEYVFLHILLNPLSFYVLLTFLFLSVLSSLPFIFPFLFSQLLCPNFHSLQHSLLLFFLLLYSVFYSLSIDFALFYFIFLLPPLPYCPSLISTCRSTFTLSLPWLPSLHLCRGLPRRPAPYPICVSLTGQVMRFFKS